MADTTSVFDMISADNISAYYTEIASNRIPLLGEALFPNAKKVGLKLEWIKGYDKLPVMLKPSAFDAKPSLRDRGGVANESTRMPFFREAMRIGEEDRQQLMMFANSGVNDYSEEIIARLYDDAASLIESASINPEVMRMSLITDAKITISSGADATQAVTYDYDYDPEGTWASTNTTSLLTTDKWSDHENSNPIADILAVKRAAALRGITLTRAIIGYGTWLDIVQNEKIRLGMYPTLSDASNVIVTDAALKSFIESNTGIKFTIYEKIYKGDDGSDTYFYPNQGVVTLLPSETLGKTWYGTTPEEADLMSGNTLADVKVVGSGVAVATEKTTLPVNLINWVSEIVLPSFENIDHVFNIKY